MENSKLEKIAIKLSKLFENKDDMKYYIMRLGAIKKNHLDYFNLFSKEDNIKLIFLISSIKRTNSLEPGKKLIQNLEFFAFFYPTGDHLTEQCDFCSGDGNIRCEKCEGSGNVQCGECEGFSELDCSSCDGVGCEDCDDSGMVDCEECEGSGELTCNSCGGDGYEQCGDCDGAGEIEDYEKKEYNNYYVACWDKKLNKIAKDFSELKNPFMQSDKFFEKYTDKFLILHQGTLYSELEELDDDKIYFYDVSDVPNNLTISMYGTFYYGGEPVDYFNF